MIRTVKRTLLFIFVVATNILHAQTTAQFTGAIDNGWLTANNWNTNAVPNATAIAVFNSQPQGNGTNNGCNINFNDQATNNGFDGQIVGAVRVLSTRSGEMNIGNSSPTTDGVLTLAGLQINGIPNVVVDNQMASNSLSFNNSIVGNNRIMRLALGSEAVFLGVSGSTTQITTQVTSAGNVLVNGGALQLNRKDGATFPATTNFTVNNGTLRISSNQTINNLDLAPGTTLFLDNATLTINGTFVHRGATISRSGSGQLAYGPNARLNYAGSSSHSVTVVEWPTSNGPRDVLITNTQGITMTAGRTIPGSLIVNGTLNMGTFQLSAASVTVNNGAWLRVGSTNTSGAMEGNFGSSASITFNPGSTVEFNGSAAQSAGARTYSNLMINNSSGVIMTGNVSINNTLWLSTGTLASGSNTLSIAGSIARINGHINAAGGTLVFNGSAAQFVVDNVFLETIGNLTINNQAGVSSAANVTIGNNLTLTAGTFSIGNTNLTVNGNIIRGAGLIDAAEGTVTFNGTSAQTIADNVFATTINNVVLNNNAGITTSSDLTIRNNLTLTAGTLSLGSRTLTLNGSISRTAGAISASSGTVIFAGSNSQTIPANTFTGAMSDLQSIVDYVFSGIIGNLTINNQAGVSSAANVTIGNNLTLTAGTFSIGNTTLTVNGNIIRGAGLIDAAEGTLVFKGTAAQVIPVGSVSATIKNLTLENAAGLTINNNHTISSALQLQTGSLVLNGRTLTLGGTVSGNGNFRGSATSGLTIASNVAAGTLNFDQTTDGITNALASLTVTSGSAVLGGKLNLYTVLNVSGGSLDLAGRNVVLKSLSSNTARVAPVSGTIDGATNVTVERWFPNAGRRFRLITSGVNTTTSIRANWMEGAMNTSFCPTCNVNPNPGYGTHITGAGANTNGFDVTGTNNPSVYTFNPSTGGWASITSTNGTLSATTPYLIFLRGDRSVDMTASGNVPVLLPGSGTTLRATGTLLVGTRTITNIAPAGKTTLIANPYPSPISWSAIYANNSESFENHYNYFEPKIGQRGAYVTVSNHGFTNNVNSTATEQIQSGQGFFVTTRAGVSAASFTIREQDKSTASNINVFRTASSLNDIGKFYISLNFTEANGQKFNADGVVVAFGAQFSNEVDADDAVQMASWDEDIAILRGGKFLSIETRNTLTENDTIHLAVSRLKTGQSYEWQFTPQEMNNSIPSGFLVDNFLKKRTAISVTDTTYIPFTVTTDAASSASGRFLVVFKPEMNTLPVTFTSVKAYQKLNSQDIQVEWQTANEVSLTLYEVQKSPDGREFEKTGTVLPKNGIRNSYSFADNAPNNGINYYRVKSLDQRGTVKFSNVVMVKTGGNNEKLSIYPNPLQENTINVRLGNLPKGVYSLQVWNSAGAQVFSSRITWNGGNGTQAIQLPENLAAGAYRVGVKGDGVEDNMILLKE